jgi:NAD(P)-dependent dehydrogenase (short-subunit alcohol dehydrogenase family)
VLSVSRREPPRGVPLKRFRASRLPLAFARLRDSSSAVTREDDVATDMSEELASFPPGGCALVVGATGGIGAALLDGVRETGRFTEVIGVSRRSEPALDLLDEASIERLAASLAGKELRLVLDATGFLHDGTRGPERSWKALDPQAMAYSFAINAIGPALLMKHLLPCLSREGKSVFATLSAKVGSIEDNRLGGWYSYRASKAALNQLVRTASVELARRWPEAICVALHPGTVTTPLTQPFAKTGLDVQKPREAARRLLSVVDALTPDASGRFFDYRGERLPW